MHSFSKDIRLIVFLIFISSCIVFFFIFCYYVEKSNREYTTPASTLTYLSNRNYNDQSTLDSKSLADQQLWEDLTGFSKEQAGISHLSCDKENSNNKNNNKESTSNTLNNSNEDMKNNFKQVKEGEYQFPFMKVTLKDNYVVLEEPSYCLTVPVTPSGKLVLVKQKRRGASRETIEFPAGMLDNDDRGNVWSCAMRELLEETGFAPLSNECSNDEVPDDPWAIWKERSITCKGNENVYLGYIMSEPSRNKQRGYGFLIHTTENAQDNPHLDEHEIHDNETKTIQFTLEELEKRVANGEMIAAGHVVFFERVKAILRNKTIETRK